MRRLRAGDWFVSVLGLTAFGFALIWQPAAGLPEKALLRASGKLVAELDLRRDRKLAMQGPLGITLVEIRGGKARVAQDPSPRQLCVQRGWLTDAGDLALCLPNQTSVELAGRERRFDSVVY